MTSQCSAALLELALAGDLPAEREELLHRHLEECESCSAALEQMAGGASWCQEAAALLVGDELDDAVPARDESSDVDFTVEHLEPSDEPNVLGRLGGYDVLEIIGRGGMGVVLKGFDRELKRCVAIKVLAPHLAQSSLAKKRFAREAQAAAAVLHPNVLAIHQVQPGGRLPFLVMPLVAGESLAGRLTAQGRLELKETLRIGMQAAAGLAAAHEQGLVHRDVKPANILLEKGVERAVLTDFGLARAADDVSMTRWGIIAGTPQYMSPEQARGEPLDGRSDLFSLGCVLYEMATGVSPFRADSTMATLRRLIDDPPPAMASLNPELPPWFIAIVDRLLQKDPSQRFGSAKEVSELLEGCLAHLQQPASVPLPAALPKPALRRAWWPPLIRFKGVLAMIATLGVGVLGVFLLSAAPPDIAGQWSGEEWGQVVLKKTSDAEYTGTYSDTFGKQPGEIQLKWSRIERRFNGTWREGEDRFGELSVRLGGDEIRGAFTTDPKSRINPPTPGLADLTWIRAAAVQHLSFGPVIEREVEVITNSIGMKLVLIPAGEFLMGSPDSDKSALDFEKPQHRVRITKPFYLGKYPVTQAEYKRVMGMNPSWFCKSGSGKDVIGEEDTSQFPVEQVSWEDAVEFCKRLSEKEKKEYRLPTEAQWEYACRTGSKTRYCFGDDERRLGKYAWFDGNSGGRTHRVGQKKPNAWGLYDMHGNVSEWCGDWFAEDYYRNSPPEDPTGPATGSSRVDRGCSWPDPAAGCRSACRYRNGPAYRFHDLGLRVSLAQTPDQVRNTGDTSMDAHAPVVITAQGSQVVVAVPGSQIVADRIELGQADGKTTPSSPPRQMFRIHAKHRVAALAYSPDRRTLAIGGDPETVSLFEAKTGKPTTTLKLFNKQEEAILAAAKRQQGVVRVRAQGDLEVRALAFSPDSSVLAVGTSIGQVKLFDTRTGAVMLSLDDVDRKERKEKPLPKFLELRVAQGNVWAVAFSPDGRLLATCGNPIDYAMDGVERSGLGPRAGLLKLWDAKTGALKQDLKGEHSSQVLDVAFSPDGEFLASAGHWPLGTGVKLWDPHIGEVARVLAIPRGHLGGGSPLCFAFSPDGKRMAMGIMQYDKSTDVTSGSINVVYPASGIVELSWPVPRSVRPVAFSPDGKLIAAFGGKSTLTLWDSSTGLPKREIKPLPQANGERWECFAFAPQGNMLAIGGVDAKGGFVEVWNLDGALASAGGASTRKTNTPLVFGSAGGPGVWPVPGVPLPGMYRVPENGVEELLKFIQTLSEYKPRTWETDLPYRVYFRRAIGEAAEKVLKLDKDPDSEACQVGRFVLLANRVYGLAQGDPQQQEKTLAEVKAYLEEQVKKGQGAAAASLTLLLGQTLEQMGEYERAADALQGFAAVTAKSGDGTLSPATAEMQRTASRLAAAAKEYALQSPKLALPPKGRLVPLDLSRQANIDIQTFGANLGSGLAELPRGENSLGGVKFRIGPKLVQVVGDQPLGAPGARGCPERVEGIPVNRKIVRLYVLQGGQWGGVAGMPVGEYRLHCEDGTSASLPIVYGENVRDWYCGGDDHFPATRAKVVWTGGNFEAAKFNNTLRLFLGVWENPYPNKKVTSLDFVSTRTRCHPFCVAITVEEP